jgi:hypothetical protein
MLISPTPGHRPSEPYAIQLVRSRVRPHDLFSLGGPPAPLQRNRSYWFIIAPLHLILSIRLKYNYPDGNLDFGPRLWLETLPSASAGLSGHNPVGLGGGCSYKN